MDAIIPCDSMTTDYLIKVVEGNLKEVIKEKLLVIYCKKKSAAGKESQSD